MSLEKNISLKQLRVLSAVVKTGTVSGAAKLLHVTPPAISLQLKILVDIAGIELLQRTAKGFVPTPAGEEVLIAARHISSVLHDCNDVLDEMKGVSHGSVKVGVVSTAKYFAPRALAAFRNLHSEIELNLWIGNRTETVAALEGYEFDFAIMGRPPKNFEVEQIVFGPHPHVLICPPQHPLIGKSAVSVAKLAKETLLMREKGSGTRALFHEILKAGGIGDSYSMEMGSNETIKQAVMAGLGVALISAHTVSVEIDDGRLGVLDIKGLPVMRNWQVIRRADKALMPAAQALWDFMIAEGRSFLPEIEYCEK